MHYGNITLKSDGDATIKALLSNGKEEVIKTLIIAENMKYRTWWEDPTGEGMGEVQYDDFEEPTPDEIKPEYEMDFEYADGRVRSADDETEIVKILEVQEVIWFGDMDTFEEDEPDDFDYYYDRMREDEVA